MPVPLLGRDGVLTLLDSCLADAQAGRGGLVWISGEAGIGKSRLLEELANRAVTSGAIALHGAGWEDPSTPAFWLWTQVLRDAAGHADPTGWPAEARGLLEGSPADADPAGRFPLFDGVARALRSLASDRPAVLVLDDLHWIDPGSLRLLRFLASGPGRLLLACGYRTGETPLGAAADLVSRATVVELGGLEPTDIATLIEAVAAIPVSPPDAEEVARITGGNPLFVSEMARLAAARGGTRLTQSVPATAYATIQRRVARVSQACHDLLVVAAVCGPEARTASLARVLGAPPATIATLVDEATAGGLLVRYGGRVGFAHAIIRDAVYDAIPPARRRALHLAVADDLPVGARHAAELAHHLFQAAPLAPAGRVVDALSRAGEAATGSLAHEVAADLYARALDLVPHDDPRRRSLLLARGAALLASGGLDAARPVYLEAAELARREDDGEGFARAALGYASGGSSFEVRLGDSQQQELLREALTRLPEPDSELRAAVLAQLSVTGTWEVSIAERARLADEAVAMARRLGLGTGLAEALATWCDAHSDPGESGRREAAASEIITLARRAGDRPLELLGYRHRVNARLELGRTTLAQGDMNLFAHVARGLNQPLYSWYIPLWNGLLAQLRGDLDELARCADEADRIGALAGSRNALVLAATQWLWVAGDRMDVDLMERLVDRVLTELLQLTGTDGAFADLYPGRRPEVLARGLPHLQEILEAMHFDAEWLPFQCLVAWALFEGDAHPAYAVTMLERLTPYADRFMVDGIGAGFGGSTHLYLGMLAATTGDDFAPHFERSLTANAAAGDLLHLAAAHRAWGLALLRTGSRTAAAPQLEQARDAYAAMGLAARASECNALLGPKARSQDAEPSPVLSQDAEPSPVLLSAVSVFRREGAVWRLQYGGRATSVTHSKGMADLARLLSRPGTETHVLDLVGVSQASAQGDLGPVLDDRAKAAYRKRLTELEEAAEDGDAQAAAEREALVEQLSAAYGLGGQARRTGSSAERARSAVTLRIKDAIGRIEKELPELGRHLRASVRTGTFCVYAPEHDTVWETAPVLTS